MKREATRSNAAQPDSSDILIFPFLKDSKNRDKMPTSTSLAVTLLLAIFSLPLARAETAAASAPTVTPIISPSAPKNAVSVSPVLLSFSIEGDGWPEWAAKAPKYNQRNEFFYSALKNLKDRTGTWPNVRVGANSEDRILFDKKIKVREILAVLERLTFIL